MNLTCTFVEKIYPKGPEYVCIIKDQQIHPDYILNINGTHMTYKSNEDVAEIEFWDCDMTRVPQGLTKIFPKLGTMDIYNSTLKKIRKEDLAEYKLFKGIYITNNFIEFLPGDLFDGFENIKEISFSTNKIKIIEPNILDGLESNNLTYVSFLGNKNYSIYYSTIVVNEHLNNIMNVKDNLKQVFYDNFKLYKTIIKEEFEAEKNQSFINDIKNILQDDSHKDFKILIGDREFNVHKFILASRSPTLAEIFKNNPEVENLSLHDIPVDTFEIILNFMYSVEHPKFNEYDQLSLFAASGRLKIEELKNFAATHIFDQINDENAMDILKLSNKYEHYELKQKSFDVIQKKYPKLKFKDEWIDNPETIRIIIEKFEEKEEAMRKLEANFENQRESM